MINLLPAETKSDITFARRNTVLRKWILASCVGVVGIVLVTAAGHLFISRSTDSWQRQVNDMHAQLNAQKQDEVQKKVTEISESVKLATQVLQRQILFSKLIAQVGAVMPSGTALQSLTISSTQGGIDLSAIATDYQSATQVQLNLSDPQNKLFEKADILNVTCENAATTAQASNSKYPCKITIRALFAKDNPFQYVKASGATK